ncbi:hypothetical protein ACJMK2_041388 [Sinanodonta woodiana]|uniref:Uncharacterized protein n=1 Tax=Sinanodonta woodiana TaxID=1069815 RepID=A0ABD3W3Z4_SINWO
MLPFIDSVITDSNATVKFTTNHQYSQAIFRNNVLLTVVCSNICVVTSMTLNGMLWSSVETITKVREPIVVKLLRLADGVAPWAGNVHRK